MDCNFSVKIDTFGGKRTNPSHGTRLSVFPSHPRLKPRTWSKVWACLIKATRTESEFVYWSNLILDDLLLRLDVSTSKRETVCRSQAHHMRAYITSWGGDFCKWSAPADTLFVDKCTYIILGKGSLLTLGYCQILRRAWNRLISVWMIAGRRLDDAGNDLDEDDVTCER